MLPFFASRCSGFAGKAVLPALALGVAVLLAPSAHAQATLTFTGGNGTPLTFTLAAPVQYTITTAASTLPIFNFVGANAGIPVTAASTGSGTITYTLTSGGVTGAPVTINYGGGNFSGGNIAATDLNFGNNSSFANLSVGNIITLSAGTFTTSFTTPGRPANGTFTTFVTATNGARISSNGVAAVTAVPEPGEWATMGMAGAGLCGLMIRARRKKASPSATLPA